jgi:lysyl endopeptidase
MGSRLTFVVLFLVASEAYAAQDPAPVPTASRYPVLPVSRLEAVLLAPLDLAQIAREDAARDQKGLPPRFAIADAQSIRPDNRGTWEDLGDGGMLWRLRILAGDGVNSLNLGFTRFTMSPHGRLLFYSTDGRQILRPFTSTDNAVHGQLWTPVVLTNDLIVELTVPKAEVGAVDLLLGSINQGYRGFGTISSKLYEKSGGCNLDVECLDPGDVWRDPMRSVGVISTGGTTFCSGSLVNDTAQDRKMYFMTANHCSISAGNAASLVVFWNYQNSFCRTPGSAASGQAGDGALTQFHTGSFFRAASAASDFTLVELDDPPVLAFNHYWAGWDRSPGDFTCTPGAPCASIHHPNTEEKRITYVTTTTATTSYGGTTSPGDGTHVWAHWATDPPGPFTVPGVTEPGSSGSPLYSDAGRFIGQLHGGPSVCGATGNNLSDYYGRFSVSWTGGGTDSTRLSNWLDAGGTGAQTVDGINNCTPSGVPAIGVATTPAPNQIQVSWSDGAPTSASFNVYRAVGTCASPGPYTRIATAVAGSPYSDHAVSGGTAYAYRVNGLTPAACESGPSACVEATATGPCTLPPSFAGIASVTNPGAATCGLSLSWSAATVSCASQVGYNVYRSISAGFTPAPGNRIATGIAGTGFTDTGTLTNGTGYYYVVRAAVDGVEETNTVERSAIPTGPFGSGSFTETFEGAGGFDNPGWSHAAVSGANDWTSSTAQSQTPTHSWFSDSLPSVSERVLVSPPFTPQSITALSFWHTFAFESGAACFDAGTLEVSTDGGGSWSVLPDASFTGGGFNGTAASSNPMGARRAWCQGTIGPMTQVTANLGSFAGFPTLKLRWRAGDDASAEGTGWYVDSVSLSGLGPAGVCSSAPAPTRGMYAISPCRLVDTRNPTSALGGPALAASSTRTFALAGSCSVPATATALAVNLTAVDATAPGHLKAYAAGTTPPATSVINFVPGVTRANNAILVVDANGAIQVENGSAGTVNFILDVVGYFRP